MEIPVSINLHNCQKMKTKYLISLLVSCVSASALFTGCVDMNDYQKFMEGGEIQYTGKISNVKVFAGDERVAVSGTLGSDPKVTMCRIYWNLRNDFVDVPVDLTQGKEFYHIIGLPENSYSFELLTYDDDGNSSVPVTASGSSYGPLYKSSIANRLMGSIKEEDGEDGSIDAVIEWRPIDTSRGAYITELEYTREDGTTVSLEVSVKDDKTVLRNYKSGSIVKHATLYRPEEDCLDVFSSETSENVAVPPHADLMELDKGRFSELALPGDASPAAPVLGLSKLWDGITQENWTQRFVSNGSDSPQTATFDTGVTSKLTKITLWNYGNDSQLSESGHRLHYDNGHMHRFQIWGSRQPAGDGSYDGWTLLGEFEVTKPSGLPVGQESVEDYEKAIAGFEFTFDENMPKARYIRIKNLGNWGGGYSFDIQEISLEGWVY